MKTSYETLRKLCYDIIYSGKIPLEFGVEVKLLGKIGKNRVGVVWRNINGGICVVGETIGSIDYWFPKEYKILGRPLSLQDVLRTIKKNNKNKPNYTDICGVDVDESQVSFERKALGTLRFIDLTLPISQQSEEDLDKLIELVK